MAAAARSDRGQAAPLYITAVVGLLFLALLFFAFGKADALRNTSQSAADAAALAAAQESRDQLKGEFLANILDGDYLHDILNGDIIGTYNGCSAAARYASLNDGRSVGCDFLHDGRWGFTVQVESGKPVGDTILPGTEGQHASTRATAVVEPRCGFDPAQSPPPSTLPDEPPDDDDGGGTGGDGADDGEDDDSEPSPGKIVCDDKDWSIDPDHLDLLPDMADLFTVRLAKD
ncbi:pilus assembly protein TadG-related protein [Streptomyces sp. NPDC050560]|uniref:pilus assembly protein TadG-related protein n=1 Tax=Streptomyces sp. NPDC050560 TaxID=3365630 RepID=UPI00379DABC5